MTNNIYVDAAIWFVAQSLTAFLVYRIGWMRRGRHDQKESLKDVDGPVLATVTVHVLAPRIVDGELVQGSAIQVNTPEAVMEAFGPAPALSVAHDTICRSLAEIVKGDDEDDDDHRPGAYL